MTSRAGYRGDLRQNIPGEGGVRALDGPEDPGRGGAVAELELRRGRPRLEAERVGPADPAGGAGGLAVLGPGRGR